ncbi:type III toxin-antitoxin system CptIN family toxin (plasmid) [Niallia taxi]|uniref:type III toxin-antitoxin system CptIN family toxin n=1 Tax=Niallia taxi TaxID=2499688 RepID=UPI003F643643
MELNKHYIYKVKDEYFDDFPDPFLKTNKGQSRPNYYVFEGDNKEVLWLIPLSSKVEKFERIMQQKTTQGKPCDVCHVCKVGNRKQAFVIQDMFPVTKEYIAEEYTLNRTPLVLYDNSDIRAIENKATRMQSLINRGVKVMRTQPDVKSIEEKLIQKLEENTPKQEVKEPQEQNNQDQEKEQREQKRKAAMRRHMAMRER